MGAVPERDDWPALVGTDLGAGAGIQHTLALCCELRIHLIFIGSSSLGFEEFEVVDVWIFWVKEIHQSHKLMMRRWVMFGKIFCFVK